MCSPCTQATSLSTSAVGVRHTPIGQASGMVAVTSWFDPIAEQVVQ